MKVINKLRTFEVDGMIGPPCDYAKIQLSVLSHICQDFVILKFEDKDITREIAVYHDQLKKAIDNATNCDGTEIIEDEISENNLLSQ